MASTVWLLVILTINLLSPTTLAESSTTTNGEEAAKEISNRVDEMKKANLIFDPKLDNKLDEMKKSLKKVKPATDKGSEKPKGPDTMATAEAVNKALQGLPGMVTALQTKDYTSALKSGIQVVTSIVNLFVPGTTKIANLVLSSYSSVNSLFTGSKVRKPEAPIIKALEDFKIEGLQDEIAGIQYLWDMMTKSIAHFEDYLNNDKIITEQLATQFYSNSFQRIGIFGRLDKQIKKYCIKKPHQGDSNKKNIDVCMALLTSYTRLSVTRSIMLARLAGITLKAEDHYKELIDDPKYTSLKEKIERKMQDMGGYKENFIYLADQQRSMDKDVLRFLGDPLNQFQSKLVIFELFSNPAKYQVLMAYLLSLDEQYEFLTDKDHVILCPEKKLSGLCRTLSISDGQVKNNPRDFPTQSWFVPMGLQLFMYKKGKEFGPFIGMFAYSPENMDGFDSVKATKLDTGKYLDAAENIVICNTNKMCDTIDSKIYKQYNLKNYHGVNYQKIASIKAPAGVKVYLSGQDKNVVWKIDGPLFGPFQQTNIEKCYSAWTTLTVYKLEDEEDGRKYVEVCGPSDGFCLQFEPGKVVKTSPEGFFGMLNPDDTVKCRPTPEGDTLNVNIPVGRLVTVKKGESSYGPYRGPAYYPNLNVADMQIQVEDLWQGDKPSKKKDDKDKGRKRSMAGRRHHHHHKHRHGSNETVVAFEDSLMTP
ncbi:uncharacterized protein [Clytia hemisphaerica]|uniref:Uncharacterized protein n=1 Tax=Clytia hemisphaerica TaxID=252671 RepID=A0A7M6DMI2_9CNID